MVCIYHSKDLDGYCSGAIVKLRFPDALLIGYDYGEEFPIEKCLDQEVIMIDVSLSADDMVRLGGACRLTWIDHHISAIKDYEEYCCNSAATLPVIRTALEEGTAACEIAWRYFFPDKEMPIAVQMLGEYDTWRNEDKVRWDELIMPFQYGMRLICDSPKTFPYSFFTRTHPDVIRGVIKSGEIILAYQKKQNFRACTGSFEIEFEGYRAICLNAGGANSQMFEPVYDESKHDLMIPFFFNGRHWKFSLYTTKDIDCSQIAKIFGGGGHKKAAGFELKQLPREFKINVKL